MTAKAREDTASASAEELRYDIACQLIYNERKHRRLTSAKFAEQLGVSYGIISAIENRKSVSPRTWAELAVALEWGSFLEFVLAGQADLAEDARFGNVRQEIRDYAVLRLRLLTSPSGHSS